MTRYNPNRLYKDPRNGRIAGVCAGIADYFDIRPGVVRLLTIIGAILTGIWAFVCVYLILAFILDRKPVEITAKPEEDKFWRQARTKPEYTRADLNHRYDEIERRTRGLEAYVTSKQFRLSRELKNLER